MQACIFPDAEYEPAACARCTTSWFRALAVVLGIFSEESDGKKDRSILLDPFVCQTLVETTELTRRPEVESRKSARMISDSLKEEICGS
jgi:hypothetical protein